MDSDKLFDLLSSAESRGIRRPKIPFVALGTFEQQSLMACVEVDKDIENSLFEFVSNEPDLDIFNERMINTGSGSSRVSLHTLVKWLLFIALEEGVEAAVRKINNYIVLDYTPAHQYLAISGVTVNKPVKLSDSITLIPFESIPSCAPKDYLDPPILKPEKLLAIGIPPAYVMQPKAYIPKAALVKKSRLIPKSFSPGGHHVFSVDSRDLYEVCEVLTLVGDSRPVPLSNWFVLDESVPCSQLIGGGWSSPTHDLISNDYYTFTEKDVAYLKAIYGKFSMLNQSVKDALRIPILRLNQARRRQSIVDKAIDLGVALEALYLSDRTYKEQIAFTFRLRASWYLGASKEDRRELINLFNKIYECRSKAIHTGHLDDKVKRKGMPPVDTTVFLEQADAVCAKTICKIIENSGFPNWEEAILGK